MKTKERSQQIYTIQIFGANQGYSTNCTEKRIQSVEIKEFKQVSFSKSVNQNAAELTESVDERCIKFSGEKWVRHVT